MLPFFEINTGVIIIWTVGLVVLNFALILFLGTKKGSAARAFALASTLIALEVFLVSIQFGVPPQGIALYSKVASLTYLFGFFIALAFLYFCMVFPHNTKVPDRTKWFLFVFAALVYPLFLFTDLIAGPYTFLQPDILTFLGAYQWVWGIGPYMPIYNVVFNGFFIAGIVLLLKKYFAETNSIMRKRLKYMVITLIVGFAPSGIFSIFLPTIGNFEYNWFGIVAHVGWVSVVSYSIMKYQQMNVRVLFTEVLIVGASFLLFLNIFT